VEKHAKPVRWSYAQLFADITAGHLATAACPASTSSMLRGRR